jgi:hypothetical protein
MELVSFLLHRRFWNRTAGAEERLERGEAKTTFEVCQKSERWPSRVLAAHQENVQFEVEDGGNERVGFSLARCMA